MADQQNPYRIALREAQEELKNIDEYVRERKAKLQKSISSLLELLGDAEPESTVEEFDENAGSDATAPKIWQRIEIWLDGSGHPFTVKQALAGLEKIGYPIPGPNNFQIMRQALKKKPEMFKHDQHSGTYSMVTPK